VPEPEPPPPAATRYSILATPLVKAKLPLAVKE
jgi:hypothetical protein